MQNSVGLNRNKSFESIRRTRLTSMKQKRNLILGLFVLILVIGAVIFFTRIADYPAAQATLVVRSGTAVIAHPGGQQDSIDEGKQTLVNSRDTITVNGLSSLMFVGAEADLAPGSELEIMRYGAMGDESQIELQLKSGQTWQEIGKF